MLSETGILWLREYGRTYSPKQNKKHLVPVSNHRAEAGRQVRKSRGARTVSALDQSAAGETVEFLRTGSPGRF